MNRDKNTVLPHLLEQYEPELLNDWVAEQERSIDRHEDLITSAERREQSSRFLKLLRDGARTGIITDVRAPEWQGVRNFLAQVSRSRTQQGFTPSEVAAFIFSLKRPLFARLRSELDGNAQLLTDVTWTAMELLDGFGIYTTEMYVKNREEIIMRQQQEMLELSTPVVQLWEGILALPIIGTLDSVRTQMVMESLLNRIVETGSQVAIVDITGVPTVDTLVAQHLLKTVTAARLMGADCIISGIRPIIAQTIVHLGVDLADVTTRASLADAFLLALERTGNALQRRFDRAPGA